MTMTNPTTPSKGGFICAACGHTFGAGKQHGGLFYCHRHAPEDSIGHPPLGPGESHPSSIHEKASSLITGPRRDSYGPVHESFERISKVWSAILGHEITPRQTALCMAGLKLCRETHKHGPDNVVDYEAYLMLADQLIESASK